VTDRPDGRVDEATEAGPTRLIDHIEGHQRGFLGTEHHAIERRVLQRERSVDVAHPGEAFARIARALGVESRAEFVESLRRDLGQDFVFRREVTIRGVRAHARKAREFAQAERLVRACRQLGARHGEQRVAQIAVVIGAVRHEDLVFKVI
jgi:Arc/MetJ family transcription regulator